MNPSPVVPDPLAMPLAGGAGAQGDSLAAVVEAELRKGTIELPVLPEAAAQVRAIMARDGGAREIVGVIEREPALAAEVLRYANSIAYAGLREITDLQQAVMRLGLGAVEQTVLALSARNAFQATDKTQERLYRTLWQHSITAALAARRLAPRSANFSAETVFLAGLLHDIGKLVVLRCLATMRRRDPGRYTFEERTVLEFFEALHCRAGVELAEAWNLPVEIRDVIGRHHEPELSGPANVLVAIVQLADLVAAKLGATLRPYAAVSLLETPGARMLRLDDTRLAALLVDVEDDVARLQDAA
jgi:putative nucleotidyltransferase with HDIG domain